jgi:Bax protein
MHSIKGTPKILIALAGLCLVAGSSLGTASEETFEFGSWQELAAYYEKVGYTETQWDEGLREVPRLFMTNMPSRWRNTSSKEVEVRIKKELFFRMMAPLILKSNEDILAEREKLVAWLAQGSPDAEQTEWLHALTLRYRVLKEEDDAAVSPAHVQELLLRVDAIPPSLTMAQSAEESGWGTSRFADVGNALFGQWAWGDKAIKPEKQRKGKGNYGIASFATPQESVSGYMLNINTHRAYGELRARRAQLRAAGKQASGMDLSPTLIHYSERGEHYVKSLNSIMRVNKLLEIDEAYLNNDPVVWLTPTGAGAE